MRGIPGLLSCWVGRCPKFERADNATLGLLLRSVDIPNSTLFYHLAKMEKAGRDGRERWYRLADPAGVLDVLVRYRPPSNLVEGFLEAMERLELP